MSGVSPISAGESGSFSEQYLRLIEDWLREFVDKNQQQQDADNQPEIEITVKERIVYGQGVNDLSPSIIERLGQLQNTPVGGVVESAVSMRVKLDGKVVLESDESGKVITNSFYEQLRDNKTAQKITDKYALDNPFVNEEELPDEYADFENLFINNELPDEYPNFNNLFVNHELKAEDNQIVNGEREPNLEKVVPQQPDSGVTYPTPPQPQPVQQTPVVTETGGARVKTALEALPDSSLKQLLTAQLSQMQELQRSQLQNQQRQFDEFIKARFTEPKNTNWWQQAAHSVANTAQTAWASLVKRSRDVKAAVAIKTLFDQSTSRHAAAYHTAGYTIARSGQSYSLSDKSGKTLMQFNASPMGVRVSPSNQLTTSAHQDLKQLRTSQSRGEEPGGAFARVGKTETEYFARVNAITTALSQYAQRQGTNVQVDGQFSYKWKATPDGKVRIDACIWARFAVDQSGRADENSHERARLSLLRANVASSSTIYTTTSKSTFCNTISKTVSKTTRKSLIKTVFSNTCVAFIQRIFLLPISFSVFWCASNSFFILSEGKARISLFERQNPHKYKYFKPMNLRDLKTLIAAGETVIYVVAPVQERLTILSLLHSYLTPQLKLPMYLWNLGQGQQFKSVNYNAHDDRVVIREGFEFGECDQSTPGQRAIAALKFVRELTHTGIFVLENYEACMTGIDGDELKSLLINTYLELTATESQKVLILLVTDEMELPATLSGLINTLELPLPTSHEIAELISAYLPTLTSEKVEPKEVAALTTAAAGLTKEDIKAGLRLAIASGVPLGEKPVNCDRSFASASEGQIAAQTDIVRSLLNYKINRFASFNLNFILEPPVYDFGGLHNLRQFIQDAKRDFAPSARAANIPLPKGCLLVGPPGTGKTLAANVSARELGFPLVSVDTAAVAIGGATYLKRLLTRVEACAPVLLYFDELDKLFTANTISGEDSSSKQILGTLLTWLQDKQSPVFVVATLNRLDALPPELTRVGRFDEIFYVGFPTAIERKQIVTLHASRFDERYQCPDSPLSESQWRILLGKTVNCTGAELARMVEKAARKLFHQSLPIQIGLQELLVEREAMVPLYVRDTDRILAIENRARYVAQPAAKEDTSIYAPPITTFWG